MRSRDVHRRGWVYVAGQRGEYTKRTVTDTAFTTPRVAIDAHRAKSGARREREQDDEQRAVADQRERQDPVGRARLRGTPGDPEPEHEGDRYRERGAERQDGQRGENAKGPGPRRHRRGFR